jgi:serine/threonine protein phosphatase PrpC
MKIRCHWASTTGRRSENQDSVFFEVFKEPKGCLKAIAAVCDGMGGQQGGQTASRLAIEEIRKRTETPPEDDGRVEAWIMESIKSIQNRLVGHSADRPELSGMGTTLVMGLVSDSSIWIANVGDSRAYRVDGDGAKQLTVDHTAVQDAINRGLYKIEDVKKDQTLKQMTSALLRNLGDGGDPTVDIYKFPLISGEAFLFCSDGLSGNLVDPLILEKDIERHVRGTPDLDGAVNNLISTAYQHGSTDNITTVLLEVGVLKRSEDMVSIEPDVEILRKQEIKQKEKIILGRHRKRLYRRLIPILVATGLLLCLTILILQYRHYKPVMPQPTDVSQVEAPLEEFSSQLPAQPSTPNHEESVSVAWYNYTEEVEQRVLDEKITFTLENHSSQVREVLLLTSRNPSMKPVERKKNIKQCLNGSGGSIRLRNIAGLKKGIWYLQVYLKTGDGEIVSKPRGIEIVGQ